LRELLFVGVAAVANFPSSSKGPCPRMCCAALLGTERITHPQRQNNFYPFPLQPAAVPHELDHFCELMTNAAASESVIGCCTRATKCGGATLASAKEKKSCTPICGTSSCCRPKPSSHLALVI
jgi:hypothetical protein